MLKAKFPTSVRLERLQGLEYEATGNFEAAVKIYDKMLKEDPTDMLAMKRKACVFESMGQTKKAIAMFVEYLHVFMADLEAWLHLADLYLEEQMYGKKKHVTP